jgi:predicted HicB family RNase H-like nuclease
MNLTDENLAYKKGGVRSIARWHLNESNNTEVIRKRLLHIAPEKAYKGIFNVRISPELHRRAAVWAAANQAMLNGAVENVLIQYAAIS